jgi:hypothetical protein
MESRAEVAGVVGVDGETKVIMVIKCCYCGKPPSDDHPIVGFILRYGKEGNQLKSIYFNVNCRDKQLAEDEQKRLIELEEIRKAQELYRQSPEFKQRMKAELIKKREKWKSQNRCVICGRKLTHKVSVGMGIGPICGKHGYHEGELDL